MGRGQINMSKNNMIVLTERRVASDRFGPTYKKGMALVEETAHIAAHKVNREASNQIKSEEVVR